MLWAFGSVVPLQCYLTGGTPVVFSYGRGTPERSMLPAGMQHRERELFIDNLLVRIHFIIVMIRWTGLAPWKFEFTFPGSLTSTFLCSIDRWGCLFETEAVT